METDIREKVARVKLISMFFIRCANDYWVEIYSLKSEYFKKYYWGDVNEAFCSYWKKVRRNNDSKTDDVICELVDMTDEKTKLIYFNVYNAISQSIKNDDLELCAKLYVFDIFLSASTAFAQAVKDVEGIKGINKIKEAVSNFMGKFKFPYQSEVEGAKVYNAVEPYLLQFIEFLKTIKINVK